MTFWDEKIRYGVGGIFYNNFFGQKYKRFIAPKDFDMKKLIENNRKLYFNANNIEYNTSHFKVDTLYDDDFDKNYRNCTFADNITTELEDEEKNFNSNILELIFHLNLQVGSMIYQEM